MKNQIIMIYFLLGSLCFSGSNCQTPTQSPSVVPIQSQQPSRMLTTSPQLSSSTPTQAQSNVPSYAPSMAPSQLPSFSPTPVPSQPSSQPTSQPSAQPFSSPTSQPSVMFQPIAIPLGVCSSFAVQAGTAVSFNGALTTINTGNIGVAPGTDINGNYVLVEGSVNNNNALAVQCTADLGIAYKAASEAICPPSNLLQAADLAGLTLIPGVYCSASGKFILSAATLTLNGLNRPNPQWIFQTATTLTTSTATSFILENGAQASNVYWALGTSATIGSSSSFVGTILAKVSITYGSSSMIVGRGLAMAAVSFNSGSTMALPGSSASSASSTTAFPSAAPSYSPSIAPSSIPTSSPTYLMPTVIPSYDPTCMPSMKPTPKASIVNFSSRQPTGQTANFNTQPL